VGGWASDSKVCRKYRLHPATFYTLEASLGGDEEPLLSIKAPRKNGMWPDRRPQATNCRRGEEWLTYFLLSRRRLGHDSDWDFRRKFMFALGR
jgi:hypothetical protein